MCGSAMNPADSPLDEDDLDVDALVEEFGSMTPAGVGAEATGPSATAALNAGKILRDKIAHALWQQFAAHH